MSVVASVAVNLDARNATQNAARFKKEIDGVANSIQKTERATATASANIQRFGIAFRSVIGPIVAITGAVNLLGRSLNVLGEREADAAALENGLRKLGGRTSDLIRLQGIADKLGKQTLFNQEDFDRGFSLLTSFQSIAVGSYERVAKAAADVAQITRQDVNSSLLQLAKALQDPEKGLTALARSGTQFTESQKEQVEQLVQSGQLLKAQDFILSEIEKQYGDAAAAAGSAGYAGAVDSLGESFRDFQERLAKGVQPTVVGTLKVFTDLFDIINKIPEPVGKAALAIAGVTTAVVGLRAAALAVIPVFKSLLVLVVANPWIALAAGITAAAIALAGYRSEAQKVADAAKTGTAADVVAARNLSAQTGQKISLLEQQRKTASGRERASIDRRLRTLRADQAKLQSAIAGNQADIETVFNQTAGELSTADKGKSKKEKDKAAEEEARLQARLRGLQIETQGTLQLALIKGKIAEAEIAGNKELAIRLQGEQRNQQILLDLQRSLEGVTDEREKQALQVKALADLEAAGIETAIDLEKRRLDVIKEQNAEFFKRAGLTVQDILPSGAGEFNLELPDLRVGEGEAKLNELKRELKEIANPINVALNGANAIGDAFGSAFTDIITGAKSAQQALSEVFKKIADAFIETATQIIAKQIALITFQSILNALGGGGSFSFSGQGPAQLPSGPGFAEGFNLPKLFAADGGFVSRPTNALIGEGAQSEYVIPANKMDGAMARYNAGARGNAVVNGANTTEQQGGVALMTQPTQINISGGVMQFNDTNYIRQDQVPAIVDQASKAGEARALRKLQMSPAARRKIGM